MTRQSLFVVLLVLSCLYAVTRGGRPERIGAVTLLEGVVGSVALAHSEAIRFAYVEEGILLVDLWILGIFLWLSFRSARFWPVWITAILAAETTVHLMRAAAPHIVPTAYLDAVAMWSWMAQIILAIGTRRHRVRLKRLGVDKPWKR